MDDGGAVLDLNDFFYFVQVVDRGGFTAAGRTLHIPKSTLSHRIQQLETNLGVRLLNRTSRRFGMSDIVADFLVRYPKVNLIAHATDQTVDIVGENYDVAVRAHSDPLPDSTLVQRTLTPAPWFLFAGSAYLDANGAPQTPKDLHNHPSLFMMRTGVAPVWRLRHSSKSKREVVMRLTPRLLSDDMIALKQAAIAGLGVVALPGYVCREDVRSGALRRVLPAWL